MAAFQLRWRTVTDRNFGSQNCSSC